MGGLVNMADDRMKNDDLRNMGNKEGHEGGGQQSPGRGQGQQGGQQTPGQPGEGQFGGQRNSRDMEDDDLESGGQSGSKNRGGQNR